MKPRLVKSQREMEGRFEDVWVLVDEEDEVETWPDDAELGIVGSPTIRQDGPVRASGAARYTVDVQLPGMLHAAVLRAPVARCRVTALDLDAARATAGVRAAIGPGRTADDGRRESADGRAGVGGRPDRDRGRRHTGGRRRRHRGPRGDLRAARPPWARGGPHRAALHGGAARDGPRRARRRARGRRRPRGADLRDARARAIAARAARRRGALGGRHAHRLGVDPGDVRRAARAGASVRPGARAGARDLRVHRRRVRREAGRRRRGGSRRRAGPRHRAAGPPRARTPRGAGRRRAPLLDAPDRDPRGAAGRNARGDRARGGRGHGRRRLGLPRRRAGALPLRLPERPHHGVPGPHEPPCAERVSRAGRRRGRDRARAGDRRPRGRARDRPARPPAPKPRRSRPGLGSSVLEQAAPRLLRPRGGARGVGEPRRPPRVAARRAPARHGLRDADLVGRWGPAGARDGAGSTPRLARSSRRASRTSARARSRRPA